VNREWPTLKSAKKFGQSVYQPQVGHRQVSTRIMEILVLSCYLNSVEGQNNELAWRDETRRDETTLWDWPLKQGRSVECPACLLVALRSSLGKLHELHTEIGHDCNDVRLTEHDDPLALLQHLSRSLSIRYTFSIQLVVNISTDNFTITRMYKTAKLHKGTR
jgi:hypothetical protein